MRKNQIKSHITLFFTLSILFVFFIVPLLIGVVQSFGYFPELGMHDITLKYYEEILSTRGFWRSVGFTIYFSLVTSSLAVLIGVFFAFVYYKNDRNIIVEKFIQLPILTPHLITTLIIYLLFSQSGVFSRICYHIGLIEEISQFIPITQDVGGKGIILAYLWKGIPFVLTTILAVLRNTNSKLAVASENIGASKIYTFFNVILPVALPSIITSFIILFAFSFGAFEVPFLLGPTEPKALPILSYNYYTGSLISDRVYAMVVNVLITGFCLVLLVIFILVDQKRKRYNIDSHLPVSSKNVIGKILVLVFCGIILLSFVPLFLWSFSKRWQWPLLFPENYSMRAFIHLFADRHEILQVVFTSIILSLFITIATIAIALPTARILAQKHLKLKGFWYCLIWAPIIIPTTTMGMGMYSIMLSVGIQDSFIGVLIANVIPCIPYAMLILQSPCELIGDRYEKQARMLGEKPVKILLKVTLPILAPSIKVASIMVFMVSFGQYFLTFLIGGGLIKTLPVVMFPYVQQGDRVLSSIYSILYILTIMLVTWLIEKLFNKMPHVKNQLERG